MPQLSAARSTGARHAARYTDILPPAEGGGGGTRRSGPEPHLDSGCKVARTAGVAALEQRGARGTRL